VYNAEIISGRISYSANEVLQVKWIPINELGQIIYKMRSPESAIEIVKSIKDRTNFPLEVVKNIIGNVNKTKGGINNE
jgi:hypothetical protein